MQPNMGSAPVEVEGTIEDVHYTSQQLDTLDEPVSATILRDVKKVATKLKYVLIPRVGGQEQTLRELRNWDLWGPLMLCVTLAILLSVRAPSGQTSLVFTAVFVIVWCGAAVVTTNAKLLGGNLSFFQSICVLGYCLFPLDIAALLCQIPGPIWYRLIVITVGFFWSTRASVVFMAQLVPPQRKALAVFPVFLFYIVISWMILVE